MGVEFQLPPTKEPRGREKGVAEKNLQKAIF